MMSGTSLDAIDVVLVSIDDSSIELIANHTHAIPEKLRASILSICTGQPTTLLELGEIDHVLGKQYAAAANDILKRNHLAAEQISAIGNHGQTVFHHPQGDSPFTIQLGDAHIIAALTGIDTVADFRRMDMALGGQGAPLTPAFHEFVFASKPRRSNRVVLNIGGIANITLLPVNGEVIGFDTGPGNLLMDAWCEHHTGNKYDKNADWASQGQIHTALLTQLLSDPFLHKLPPKSTGREHYNKSWLQTQLNQFANAQPSNTENLKPVDVQRTLCEFTACSIAEQIEVFREGHNPELLICGGGVNNPLLFDRIQTHLPHWQVSSTTERGVPADWVEAMAFAWLARQRVHNLPSNLPSVTGAKAQASLGVLISAKTNTSKTNESR